MSMTRSQKKLNLALAGLVLVAGAFFLLLLENSADPGEADEVLVGAGESVGDSPDVVLPRAQLQPEQSGARVVQPTRAELRVLVTDLEGLELDRASLVGWGPSTADVEVEPDRNDLPSPDKEGVHADLEPGRWVLRAAAPLHLPQEEIIHLSPGDGMEVPIALQPAVVVEGGIVNMFGSPLGNGWVWFLPPGVEHPKLPRLAEGLQKARVERDGRFESPLLPPGEYRMSFGPVGRSDLMDERPWPLKGGTRYGIRGVVSYRSQMEVLVLGLDAKEGRRAEVVLYEPKSRGRDRRRESLEMRGLDQQKERERESREGLERWKGGPERAVKDGSAMFTRLREGRYRVGVTFGGLYYQSTEEIRLGSEVSLLVTVHPDQEQGGTRKEPGPLSMVVEELVPDVGLGGVGFHILSQER